MPRGKILTRLSKVCAHLAVGSPDAGSAEYQRYAGIILPRKSVKIIPPGNKVLHIFCLVISIPCEISVPPCDRRIFHDLCTQNQPRGQVAEADGYISMQVYLNFCQCFVVAV